MTKVKLAASQSQGPAFNQRAWDAAVKHIHEKGTYDSSMLSDNPLINLVKETNRVIRMAVDNNLADNLPPQEMINSLRDDVFVFSACKTHVELTELGSYLVDPGGKVASWSNFRKAAKSIYETYNVNYLEAEYIFATSSAQMAAKWAEQSKDGDRYNLQYRTAQDDRVRNSHRIMHGTTLPPSDTFWDSYYPPNGWRCRCTAIQVIKGKYPQSNSEEMIRRADEATTEYDAQGRDRNAMFRFNPGKQKVIFPPHHPYRRVNQAAGVKKVVSENTSAGYKIGRDVSSMDDLNTVMAEFATHYPEYFAHGFRAIGVEPKAGNNGSTDCRGRINISSSRLSLIMEGLTKISKGLPTSFREEDALSTLWHEITHNRNKVSTILNTKLQRRRMETANEFVARNTLEQFMKDLGGELQNKSLIERRESTSYNDWVVNYRNALKKLGANIDQAVRDVSKHLFDRPYTEQTEGLIQAMLNQFPKMRKSQANDLVTKLYFYSESGYNEFVLDRLDLSKFTR